MYCTKQRLSISCQFLWKKSSINCILARWQGSVSNDFGITRHVSPAVLLSPPPPSLIMWIGFPWAMRCPVSIFGLVLCWWLYRRVTTKHRTDCSILKVRGTGLSSSTAYISLAMPAMFQSKRKLAEEMLSRSALSCLHAICVPLLS